MEDALAETAPARGCLSIWTGKVDCDVSVIGRNSCQSHLEGSFDFTIYLAEEGDVITPSKQSVSRNSVLGRMAENMNANYDSPIHVLSATGSAGHFIRGTYNPQSETVELALHRASFQLTAKRTARADASQVQRSSTFSMNWNTGRRSPMDDTYEDVSKQSPVSELPEQAAYSPGSDEDHLLGLIPMTTAEEHQITLDLENPEPQAVTYRFVDKTLGSVAVQWTFLLVPLFVIERDDRETETDHSFISNDLISFHASIPGVKVRGSDWERLISWHVTPQNDRSGEAVPSTVSQTSRFSFTPRSSNLPNDGSARRRPMSYVVTAAMEGSTQHYFLRQDKIDMLRQGYVDQGAVRVPQRSEIASRHGEGSARISLRVER